ncbi:hypothetical protein OUZ56_009572 [Daphnia magna]|uniref:Uncharacterized protein n=1 Tax=Daphnia magna TaxID=35525 RepID=A0ABR0AGC4_9CRUS|nr:hypothetical protein OUZ56_009572 [Daphnia magna]
MDDPIAPKQHQNMASAEKINNDSDVNRGVQMETEDFPNMESNHHETSDGSAILLEKEDPDMPVTNPSYYTRDPSNISEDNEETLADFNIQELEIFRNPTATFGYRPQLTLK